MVFLEQRAEGLNVWQDPLIPLRFPKLFDLRADPFERADRTTAGYDDWPDRPCVPLGPAHRLRRPVDPELQRFSTAPEAR